MEFPRFPRNGQAIALVEGLRNASAAISRTYSCDIYHFIA
jgi:hypothetical protein